MIDEGPSPEDLERFSDATGYCPHCGAEISDLAPYCPECGDAIPGGPTSRPPIERHFQQKFVVVVIALILIAFFIYFVL